jgi:uncharacterized BrkB/YihY/UPF0761 family membrane protein
MSFSSGCCWESDFCSPFRWSSAPAIARLGKFLGDVLPAPELILHVADFMVSVGITAVLFAAMYRFLPITKVEWRDVWVGAAVTSLLFYLGKLGLGLYLAKGAVGSSYGAAGSILVLMCPTNSLGLFEKSRRLLHDVDSKC